MKKKILRISKDLLVSYVLVSAATIIGWFFSKWDFQETNIVITYLLSVLLVSRFTNGYFTGFQRL